WLGPARSTPHLLAGVAPTRPDPPWAGARPGNRARWASRQAERPPCWPSRRRGWGACAQASARRIEALGARQTPGVLRIVTINLLGRGGRFLQVGVQGDAVVEDEALALPFTLGVGQTLEVEEDAAIELIDRQAQLLHPGAGHVTSDAARAVHGHALALGLPRRRTVQQIYGKIPKVVHLRIDGRFEIPESGFNTVALVAHHQIGARHHFTPLGGTDVGVGPSL